MPINPTAHIGAAPRRQSIAAVSSVPTQQITPHKMNDMPINPTAHIGAAPPRVFGERIQRNVEDIVPELKKYVGNGSIPTLPSAPALPQAAPIAGTGSILDSLTPNAGGSTLEVPSPAVRPSGEFSGNDQTSLLGNDAGEFAGNDQTSMFPSDTEPAALSSTSTVGAGVMPVGQGGKQFDDTNKRNLILAMLSRFK
jgi:hypothetical protein